MPEIVDHYAQYKDLTTLSPIYDSLITLYIDDVEKYAASATRVQVIRHVIRSSFAEAGKHIAFNGFGNSNYGSREVGEALRSLEKALLIHLLYPLTNAKLPMLPNLKKSPCLMVLDTGMLNYFAGIQKDILRTADLNTVYQGTMIEHLVGQELLATQSKVLSDLSFWVREKKTSTAEVDYVLSYDGKLIPIEVKSGAEGKLRSLHLYMDMAPHTTAIRFYAGQLSITEAVTPEGKAYHLFNLPYFLASQTKQYVFWSQKQHSTMNNS